MSGALLLSAACASSAGSPGDPMFDASGRGAELIDRLASWEKEWVVLRLISPAVAVPLVDANVYELPVSCPSELELPSSDACSTLPGASVARTSALMAIVDRASSSM